MLASSFSHMSRTSASALVWSVASADAANTGIHVNVNTAELGAVPESRATTFLSLDPGRFTLDPELDR